MGTTNDTEASGPKVTVHFTSPDPGDHEAPVYMTIEHGGERQKLLLGRDSRMLFSLWFIGTSGDVTEVGDVETIEPVQEVAATA